jgi:DNA-binding MarR family transcriptional regulator
MAFRLPILPDPRDAGFMAWVQLARTYSKMTRCLEQLLDHHGITLPQFDVLATLSVGEDITQQDLAQRLLVTKGNVCGVLDRMEKNHWVERRTDAHDRRSNRLFLTTKGRRLLAKVLPAHEALIARVVRPLLPSDSQQLYQLLERLENALDALPPETLLVPPKQHA